MGWFDVVASKYGCRMQGTTDVAFTVLDVLGYLEEIPVCVAYDIDGEITTEFPPTYLLEKAKPVIEKLPGWKCDIRGIKNTRIFRKTAANTLNLWKKRSGIRSHLCPMDQEETISFTDRKAKRTIKTPTLCLRGGSFVFKERQYRFLQKMNTAFDSCF